MLSKSVYKIKYQQNNKIFYKITTKEYFPPNIIYLRPIIYSLNDFLNRDKDIYNYFSQFMVLVKSKIDIKNILEVLPNNNILKDVVIDIKNAISSSSSIYEAIKKYRFFLGKDIILLFKILDTNTKLEYVIESIYLFLSKSKEIKDKVVNTLRYPLFLVITLILALILIFSFVLPKFSVVFNMDNLPYLTKLLFAVNSFFSNYFIYFFIFISLYLFIMLLRYNFSFSYKYNFNKKLINNLEIFKYIELFKFSMVMKFLLKDGYSLQEALSKAILVVKNIYIKFMLEFTLNQLLQGQKPEIAFEKSKLFDDSLSLIKVGFYSNNLEDSFKNLEEFYKNKIDSFLVKINFIVPIIIFVIGIIILWVFLGLFLPIWNLDFVKGYV